MNDFMELAGTSRVVRTMPNTPATVQKGMTVWCCSDDVSKGQRDSVAKFLSSLGEQHYVQDESYLDMATAVSGSGPGYVLVRAFFQRPRRWGGCLPMDGLTRSSWLIYHTFTHPILINQPGDPRGPHRRCRAPGLLP